MRTAAILPVKRFSLAKRRLRASVAEPLRAQLAEAMAKDVLAALSRASAIELTIVITDEPSLASHARAHGALALADTADAGQSAAVMIGIEHAQSRGIARVLCVPGDCPALNAAELDRLLASDAPRASGPAVGGASAADELVVIVPDRHGSGTNGLLLAPPDVIEPSFGPGSCARHRALAVAAGAAWRVERLPSLLLDIDTGEDLAALLSGPGAGAAAAAPGRFTRAALEAVDDPRLLSVHASG